MQRPDPSRSHTQHARYLHYLGRLRAVQLSYTEARDLLQQALRKAPGGPTATGFRLLTLKWLTQVRRAVDHQPKRGCIHIHIHIYAYIYFSEPPPFPPSLSPSIPPSLPTYLPTYLHSLHPTLPTYLPTYLITYLPTSLHV